MDGDFERVQLHDRYELACSNGYANAGVVCALSQNKELILCTPVADVFIDDKVFNADHWQWGQWQTNVRP